MKRPIGCVSAGVFRCQHIDDEIFYVSTHDRWTKIIASHFVDLVAAHINVIYSMSFPLSCANVLDFPGRFEICAAGEDCAIRWSRIKDFTIIGL